MFSALNDMYHDATSQLLVAALELHVLIVGKKVLVFTWRREERGVVNDVEEDK